MSEKLKVGILGATGMVGQRFISLLENHPWFEVVTVAASPRSAGKTYEEAVGGRWKMDTPMPEAVKKLVVMDIHEVEKVAATVDFVFSAVDMTKEEIKAIEEEYAKTETPVVSNNSAHRWTPDVPMVVPEINPEHFDVIEFQKKRLGTTRGFVAVKPNCSIQSYAPVLTAWKEFEPYEVVATTYQAISGRPIHFRGVQTVVLKLFHIVCPDNAYFGQKDAQQLAVIKRMVKDLSVDITIHGCPIIREQDGLAKSSRNTYLNEEERQAALILSKSLALGKQMIAEGEKDAATIKKAIADKIETEPLAKIDYVDVVDFATITPIDQIAGETLVAIAVYIGKTRLIDNFIVEA